ncbi:hypothetical protein FGO68_gene10284 [Halteria grandinella]|uniref:Uncharacterized protein n=1 Tax=Halteria grandinella TaxID=5974 RepID=A0A8J8TAS7_HALGN|nr:hypothetical protein FGO68_gene10284 [Halteria grandinella]
MEEHASVDDKCNSHGKLQSNSKIFFIGNQRLLLSAVPKPSVKIQCPESALSPCVATVTWPEIPADLANYQIETITLVLNSSNSEQTYEASSQLHSWDIVLDSAQFSQNQNVTVKLGIVADVDSNNTIYSEGTTFTIPGIPIVTGSLISKKYDMISPSVIYVNLTNISIANDPVITPLLYMMVYSPNDENSWVNLTTTLTVLPDLVNLTDGLTSGKFHYFMLMVSNRFGDTYSSVLKVVGCKEPQTPPGIPYMDQSLDGKYFWIKYDTPTDDGGTRITNYTLLIQNWRTFDRTDDSIALDIYSVYAEKEFSGGYNYGSWSRADISSNYHGFPPEPGFEYRVYITASYNMVGKGPGQSEYLQFFVPSLPLRMPHLRVINVVPNQLRIDFDTLTISRCSYE